MNINRMIGTLTVGIAAGLSVGVGSAAAQTVVNGPIYNSNTKARYYLLQGGTYQQMRAKATAMGGHLTTVESLAENTWLNQQFGNGGLRKFFIGLSDAAVDGTWVWESGSSATYRNWSTGEPSPGSNHEDYAVFFGGGTGQWFARHATYTEFGVIEITGDLRVPSEFATIEAAAAHVGNGSRTIAVAEGTYALSSSVTLPNLGVGPRGVLRGAESGGTLILGPTGIGWALQIQGGWVIENVNFRSRNSSPMIRTAGGFASGGVTFVECDLGGAGSSTEIIFNDAGSALHLERCVMRDSLMGVRASQSNGIITLTNTLTRGVTAPIASFVDASVRLSGCTFMNQAGLLLIADRGELSAVNCAFDAGIGGLDVINNIVSPFVQCIMPSSSAWVGPGCVIGSPRLDSNGVPLAGSPCLDAGLAERATGGALDVNGMPRIRGSTIDIGAVEAQPDVGCAVDFNADGFVDFFDYDDFVAAFETGC